jgi:hypothetical protein
MIIAFIITRVIIHIRAARAKRTAAMVVVS